MSKTIAILGASGAIGQVALGMWPEARQLDHRHGDLARYIPDLSHMETVIHLAGGMAEDIATAENNMSITMRVIRACNLYEVRRLVFASSVRADEPSIGMPVSFYGASKLAQEALVTAWAHQGHDRIAVNLRIGHFAPGSMPPVAHELVRVGKSALEHHLYRAATYEGDLTSPWLAIGQLTS